MKYKYLLSAVLLLSTFIFSFANSSYHHIFQDTLPSINPNYKGFRLAITDVTVDQTEEWIIMHFTAINTGIENIVLGKNISTPSIVINFDETTSNSILDEYKNSFTQILLNSELNIDAGAILFDRKLKIKNNNFNPESKGVVENNLRPGEISDVSLNDNSKTSIDAKDFNNSNDDDNCSDLIIESISIVKQSKNSVTLKYKIKNQGKKPVSVTGNTKSENDNLAMTFHMSSSEKLTRGSIPIGGTFLKDGKQIPDGKLYPGKSLVDEIKVDIRNMTRFTPIIILQIDPYLSAQECNETNNINYIKVKNK